MNNQPRAAKSGDAAVGDADDDSANGRPDSAETAL